MTEEGQGPPLDERGVTERRIEWSRSHADEWHRAIREGDRATARALYDDLGRVLREEIREEGGRPVLSDPATNRRIRARVAEMPGHRALDVGCGPTPVAAMSLRDTGFRATGIDVSAEIVGIARDTTEGVELVVGDGEALPFADASFDVLTCDDTLEHAFDQQAMVREMARVLRPGGRLLLVTPNASGAHVLWARLRDLRHRRRRPREAYHVTQSHVRELRWREVRRLFGRWFRLRDPELVDYPDEPGFRRINRLVRLPGMWRFGAVHFLTFERLGSMTAARHYAAVTDARPQTSPGFVRAALENWSAGASMEGPVLDLGTGRGANLETLGSGLRTVGMDVSAAALRDARHLAPVVAGDGGRLPFRDGAFGTVVCTEVLEHVEAPGRVLGEIARVLRPGGLVYVTTPNYANLAGLHKWLADRRSGRRDWEPWGVHGGGFEAFVTGRRLRRWAEDAFEVERVRGLDYGQALTGRFRPLDRFAWSRWGKPLFRRLLPALEGSTDSVAAWHGMHVELVLRKRG